MLRKKLNSFLILLGCIVSAVNIMKFENFLVNLVHIGLFRLSKVFLSSIVIFEASLWAYAIDYNRL